MAAWSSGKTPEAAGKAPCRAREDSLCGREVSPERRGVSRARRRGSLGNLLPLAERRAGSGPLFPAVAVAVVSAFFSFGGWWEAGRLAGEIRDPEKNPPRAFTGGVLLVSAVYPLISFAFLYVLPLEEIASNTAFVAQFGSALFGRAGAETLSVCSRWEPSTGSCPTSFFPLSCF
jgi:amino acid transporter